MKALWKNNPILLKKFNPRRAVFHMRPLVKLICEGNAEGSLTIEGEEEEIGRWKEKYKEPKGRIEEY